MPLPYVGAASGIGRALTLQMATAGCKVYACDRNEQGLIKEYGKMDNVVCVGMDITSTEDVERAVSVVRKHTDRLFTVVNCAGIAGPPHYKHSRIQGCIELDVDKDVMPVININLMGMWRVNHAFFPLLWESRGSNIVNIASLAGLFGAPGMGPYACSKFGVVGYTEVLRRELAPYRIRVICIEPGFVRTALTEGVFRDEPKDFSHTRLFADRGVDESGLQLSLKTMPTPELVSTQIYDAVFNRAGVNIPDIMIDVLPKMILWKVCLFMPRFMSDWVMELMAGGRKAKIDAAWR